jgi:hypothetical protein
MMQQGPISESLQHLSHALLTVQLLLLGAGAAPTEGTSLGGPLLGCSRSSDACF